MELYNFFNFTSFYAFGADCATLNLALAFKLEANDVGVWVKPALGAVIGVTYQVSDNRLFIADCTYICHINSFHRSSNQF